jgi:hypothetical protein
VAVGVGKVTCGRGAYVCEEQARRGFGGDAGQVDAVPGGDSGSEDAGFRTEAGRGVVSDSEAVAIVWAAVVLWVVSRMCLLMGCHMELTIRRRESKDCVRMEWEGFRMSSERRISSLPL